jgi:hypothetical protein
MDPDVLQTILALPSPPAVARGSVSGFRVKMWGIYPALVPSSPGDEVRGTVWHVSEARHFARLAEYETGAYTWCACEIRREDGEVVAGRTFCWRGNPENRELEEGAFDLERYRWYFKASVVRRREES